MTGNFSAPVAVRVINTLNSCRAGSPTLLRSPVKDAVFSASAPLQTTKAIMNPALWALTWHAINAKKQTASHASCCNLLLVLCPLSLDGQIF